MYASFDTAISGLRSAQRVLEVVAQNVANANTPGYSRQVLDVQSRGATTTANFYTGQNVTMLGGVEAGSATRIRDAFLEASRVNASSTRNALDAQQSILSGVETLMPEPSDSGLQSSLDAFYASWHQLSLTPDSTAAGALAVQSGTTVAARLKSVSDGLDTRWDTSYAELQASAAELNSAATSLASLNGQISAGTVSGQPINELLDKRDLLVRQIGDLVGGRVVAHDDQSVDVIVNGITLVAGNRAETFTLTGAAKLADAAATPPALSFQGIKVPVGSGKVAGLLAGLGSDLPGVQSSLDDIALALKDAVNTVHAQGHTLDGRTGLNFFAGTSAGDLTVLAASSADLAVASANGVIDGENAQAIGDLSLDATAATVLGGGRQGASVQFRALIAEVGTRIKGLSQASAVQESVLASVDQAVSATSGVSIDEEMGMLVQYQRAYEASARVIRAVDEMLDTLVNRTGGLIMVAISRVTNAMMNATAMRGMQANLSRNQHLQEQLSSGKMISTGSDDPAGAVSAMHLRAQRQMDDQYLRNIDDATGRLVTADSALQNVSSLVQRAKQLLVNAQSPAQSDAGLAAISTELTSIRASSIDAYNVRWLDRPVFGGSVNGTQAINPTSGAYLGNDATLTTRISREVSIRTDVAGTAAAADQLPSILADAAAAAAIGDNAGIQAAQDALDAALKKITNALGDVGARTAQLEATKNALTNEQLDFTARISENEDVDLPKVILDLQASQVAYQASLASSAKILQQSLLDYLR